MFALQPELKVFTGSANRELAERICKYIGVPLGQATISSFPDGETYVRIEENIRGHDVFIVQPTSPPTNQHLMELLIMVDAARRASADRITAVIPFFGYARQDRKDQPRVPITAKPGQPGRHDYEYRRNGTANLFMMFAPLEGWRHVKVTDRHTAVDYAQVLNELSSPSGVGRLVGLG